jgi:predicted permease
MDDIRFALRMLRKHLALTTVAVLTLALGIGANTAIFSVVDAVLLRPLGYRNPGQLVTFNNTFRERPIGVSTMELEDYVAQTQVFDKAASVLTFDGNLTGGDQPERVQAVGASANYFEILGVPAQLGRTFASDEQRKGWTEVAVISDGLWRRRFGGSPDVIGKKIRIDDDPWTVIGVMPPGFGHPDSRLTTQVEVWAPCGFAAEPFQEPKRQFRFLDVIGRLRAGTTMPQAQVALGTVQERLKAQYPEAFGTETKSWGVRVAPLQERVLGGAGPGLLLLLGAVVLVLLIACTNVANLLLARASVRIREMAIRKALGATRGQIVRQLLTESVTLSLVGGVMGLFVAYWGIDLLVAFAPPGMPRVGEIHLDLRVLAFTLTVSIVCGLMFGVFPALQSSRAEPQAAMKEGGSSVGGGRRHRLLSGLVVGEFALALVLLGGAGLLLRSLWNAGDVKPGFDARGVLTARLWLPQPNKLEAGKYFKPEQRGVFFTQLLSRLAAEPSVDAAALISSVPLRGDITRGQFGIFPEGRVASGELQIVQGRFASADYFRAMRIPLQSGRTFAITDDLKAPPVVVVNQTLARHFWPGEDAVGKRFKLPPGQGPPADPWFTIVGVVADVKTSGLDAPTPDELYTPTTQGVGLATGLVVRAREGSGAQLTSILRAKLREIDPDLPVFDVATLEDVLAQAVATRRFFATLLATFAAVALALAALGIYGVMAYAVTQRQQEIAVRMALGAKERDVLRMVIRRALSLAGIGAVLGAGVLLVLSHVFASLLFGVPPTDVATFGSIGAALVAVALLASWLPARRAARIHPMTALRRD